MGSSRSGSKLVRFDWVEQIWGFGKWVYGHMGSRVEIRVFGFSRCSRYAVSWFGVMARGFKLDWVAAGGSGLTAVSRVWTCVGSSYLLFFSRSACDKYILMPPG